MRACDWMYSQSMVISLNVSHHLSEFRLCHHFVLHYASIMLQNSNGGSTLPSVPSQSSVRVSAMNDEQSHF